MKFARNIIRSFTSYLRPHIFKNNNFTLKSSFTSVTIGLAAMYSFTKVFPDQLIVVETQDNLKDGQVRQVLVGPKPQDTILVINHQGTIYAIQSKCSHFGFSLSKGILVGDKIICPLHNAGFSIKNGQPEHGPVFDGLKTFTVQRSDGMIKVSVPKQDWSSGPTYKQLGKDNINKNQKIVIIGAGVAGLSAAQSLRKNGYKGYIYLVTKQSDLPYDRTMLSKGMNPQGAPKPIRSQQSLQNNGIIVLKQSNVTGINYDDKKVNIEGKQALSYDKLLIASGVKNRVPPIKGLNETSYFTLRTKGDYAKINEAIRAPQVKNITIIGGGFIGLQVASAIKLALKQLNITIVTDQSTTLKGPLGESVGGVLQKLAQKNGIKIITKANVKQIQSQQNGRKVVLDGNSIPTDVLIVSTGVQAQLGYLQGLQQALGGIKTNAFLQTNKKDVFAAGDIATYPYWYTGEFTRIQHYNQAIYQGSVAGINMAGKKFPVDNIPFFWTRQFNNSLVFTGVTHGWDDIHIVGDLNEMKFVAYYIRKQDDKVLGAAAMNSLNKIQVINQAMKNGVMPSATTIKNPQFVLQNLLNDIKKKDPKCARCTMCS